MVAENMDFMRSHPETPSLYRSGVTYARTLWWEPIPALYARGTGDCKSLATALCAQYRLMGIRCQPVFRWVYNSGGGSDYHILVQTESGWEDPSKILGMGRHENSKFFDNALSHGDSDFLRND